MRKAFFILNATVLFWISLVFAYGDTADAFASKVVQQAAKKVVKEAVKDEAVKMSMNMVLNYKYTPPSDRDVEKLNTPTSTYKPARNFGKMRKPKKGYAPVCLSKHRKKARINDKETIEYCDKPMEVKQTLTPADKNKVGDHVEKALDKATFNKGLMKFINFFVPFWIVGAASTVIDLLLDGELSNFFGNLAYDSLVATGLLVPSVDEVPKVTHDKTDMSVPDDLEHYDPVEDEQKSMPVLGQGLESYNYNYQLPEGITYVGLSSDHGIHRPFYYQPPVLTFKLDRAYYSSLDGYTEVFGNYDRKQHIFIKAFTTHSTRDQFEVYYGWKYFLQNTTMLIGKFNVDRHYVTHRYQSQPKLTPDEVMHTIILSREFWDSLVPAPPEPLPEVRPDEVPISKPNTTIKIPSPESVPVIDKSTGKVVKPAPESTPDAPVWITPEGTPVPEDNITVGDITVTPTPDGNIINKPTPDSPLIEDIIPIDPTPTEPPVEEIPEPPAEFVCTDRLRKPRFDRLGQEISTTFPFNIPFDLQKSAENLFVNMGNERPNFSFDFDFLSKDELNHSFEVKLPKIFDEWRPVWQSLMVFAFDVALLYMIWRFIGGGS